MVENVPKLERGMGPHSKKALHILNMVIKNKSILRQTILKLQNTKVKNKIIKTTRRENPECLKRNNKLEQENVLFAKSEVRR